MLLSLILLFSFFPFTPLSQGEQHSSEAASADSKFSLSLCGEKRENFSNTLLPFSVL